MSNTVKIVLETSGEFGLTIHDSIIRRYLELSQIPFTEVNDAIHENGHNFIVNGKKYYFPEDNDNIRTNPFLVQAIEEAIANGVDTSYKIKEIPKGTLYRIQGNHGYEEWIETFDMSKWNIA